MKMTKELQTPYIVLIIIYIYFIVAAFIVDTPREILNGLISIIRSRDILITDYIEIAGIGASLVNSAIISLIYVFYLMYNKVTPIGSTIMSFWMLSGFSFFGKNLFNIWPVVLGGYLYSKFRREHFTKYAVVTMLATSLSPAVSQIAFEERIPLPLGLLLGFALGVFLGFIMSPISDNAMHSHHGYNLYNVGFAAGIIAIMIRVVLKAFGMDISPVFIWNTDSTATLSVFLIIIFVFLILTGLYCGKENRENLLALSKRTGRSVSDFYLDYGASCYINMGVLGILSTLTVILIGGHINGPIMGGIFAVAGYGCYGKHVKNTVPIMVGCLIGGGLMEINGHYPSAMLAVLFGTCLAPIAGTFGWKWGLVAGFLHINISMNIGEFSGGMNLYNNGLAGGLVVMFLLPLIEALRRPPRVRPKDINLEG